LTDCTFTTPFSHVWTSETMVPSRPLAVGFNPYIPSFSRDFCHELIPCGVFWLLVSLFFPLVQTISLFVRCSFPKLFHLVCASPHMKLLFSLSKPRLTRRIFFTVCMNDPGRTFFFFTRVESHHFLVLSPRWPYSFMFLLMTHSQTRTRLFRRFCFLPPPGNPCRPFSNSLRYLLPPSRVSHTFRLSLWFP